MTRDDAERWIAAYEAAWREPGTGSLPSLFTPDATYIQGPYRDPVTGLDAIAEMWNAEREEGEEFEMAHEIVAVEGDTAVVRLQVDYSATRREQWRDLWIVKLDSNGLCTHFEEWPSAP